MSEHWYYYCQIFLIEYGPIYAIITHSVFRSCNVALALRFNYLYNRISDRRYLPPQNSCKTSETSVKTKINVILIECFET